MSIMAIDIGYGYTKALSLGGQPFITASQVGAEETIRYHSDIVSDNHAITVQVGKRWYFVGEYAELQSASASQTLDVTRTGSTEQKALFYAAASELQLDPKIAVITGLPVADFDARNRGALRHMLTGRHTVRRKRGAIRQFEVLGVYVIPQAMGSLFALILDKQGQLVDGDLAEGRVGIIDVGTLTTNFILVDRLRYVETGSDSITTGMAEALTKVAKDLKREHGLDWSLKLRRVDQAVRERTVEVYGDPVNISAVVDRHLEAIADTVVSKARSLWGSGVDLKAVVLTGGGSVEFAPYIRRAYPHLRRAGGDPQFANVTGFLRSGIRRFANK